MIAMIISSFGVGGMTVAGHPISATRRQIALEQGLRVGIFKDANCSELRKFKNAFILAYNIEPRYRMELASMLRYCGLLRT